jgi:hypothetical protein
LKLVTATLVKRTTEDGFFEVLDNVSIGKKYKVDLDTLQVAQGFNTNKKQPWEREIIFTDDGEWFPTEILDFIIE